MASLILSVSPLQCIHLYVLNLKNFNSRFFVRLSCNLFISNLLSTEQTGLCLCLPYGKDKKVLLNHSYLGFIFNIIPSLYYIVPLNQRVTIDSFFLYFSLNFTILCTMTMYFTLIKLFIIPCIKCVSLYCCGLLHLSLNNGH